jgi:hypothetical protein
MGTIHGCAPADVSVVTAQQTGDALTMIANGDTPTPGWDVCIERSPLTVEPPAFTVLACPLPGAWPQVVTPFEVRAVFHVGEKRGHVIVYTSTGPQKVPVEDGSPDDQAGRQGLRAASEVV